MHLKNKNIAIVGGGLVGSLLSIYLKRHGANITVFDKRSDIRNEKSSIGRSINLALSDRGINALKSVGALDEVMKIGMPMFQRIMHSDSGELTFQPYGKKSQAIFSVSRHTLNSRLMDIAEKASVKFYFNKECLDIDSKNTTLFFKDTELKFDYIFGADGAGSIVRNKISQQSKNINPSVEFISSDYKELCIPADINGSHKIDNKSLHIWPRKSYMVIALPNLDGTFTCTLFAPKIGHNSFENLRDKKTVNKFFKDNFRDLFDLIPNLSDQYFDNPTSPLGFVRCKSWIENNTILIGDACHATVPFYGQGMNCGFEDCYLLDKWINSNPEMNHQKLSFFLNERIMDTSAMQELSMNNYKEMRDKTADETFLLQKKIEEWFSEKHPKKWMPLYSMVTFSLKRYSKALELGNIQDKIMQSVMKDNDICGDFNFDELHNKEIEKKILAKIQNINL